MNLNYYGLRVRVRVVNEPRANAGCYGVSDVNEPRAQVQAELRRRGKPIQLYAGENADDRSDRLMFVGARARKIMKKELGKT